MSNKKYIKVSRIKIENNDYGYEIYAVNDGKIIRFKQQEKIIMQNVIKNFRCIKKDDNTLIYPNYNLIMLYFQKEKLISKPKKVNRTKSRKIIAGILIGATIISGAYAIDKIVDEDEITIEQLLPFDFNNKQDNINEFCYEFEKPNDKEALHNSENYMKLYKKYEKMYGVDAQLLSAIGAQESSGIHYSHSINGGYATGIMGIEYNWSNEEIRVFNFEKNEYETIVVDYSRIGELEYNIQIGAAIFQNYFYHTLKNADSISPNEYLPFTLQKYNMGPGNMRKVLGHAGNWINNRDMIDAGDKYYFEHVLSRLDNDTIIKIRLTDGSYYSTKIVNLSLEKHHGRS